MPEEFFLVRRQERELKRFFQDKLGWPLRTDSRYCKLEKIPAVPQPYMGIDGMQGVGDYVLLACTLAFLEEQEVDGQFLLSELLETLPSLFPESCDVPLDWNLYVWRNAIVRVIKTLAEMRVIDIVEDRSEGFLQKGLAESGGEALYRVTPVARTCMRFFPREFSSYRDAQSFCEAAQDKDGGQSGADAFHTKQMRIFRKLLLEPAYCIDEETAQTDFLYILGRRSDSLERFAATVDLDLELYRDAAMLVSTRQPSFFSDYFPIRMKGLHEIVLHTAAVLRSDARWREKAYWTETDFLQLLAAAREARGNGWTKEYREMSDQKLAGELLPMLEGWNMVRRTEEGLLSPRPPVWRMVGYYDVNKEKQDAQ